MTRADVTAVIPFRGDGGGPRSKNAGIVLTWLTSAGIPTILSEHSAVTDQSVEVPSQAQRIHTLSDGAFNKAMACNVGVLAATTPVVALVDADTMVRASVLVACATRVRNTDEVIRPFGWLVELSESETELVAREGLPPTSKNNVPSNQRGGETIPWVGGIAVLRRERYLLAGGMDERFMGWGGEDDALSWALRRTGSSMRILRTEPAFHLWHPRSLEHRYEHPNYQENLERALWWRSGDADEIDSEISRARAEFLKRETR